MLMKQRIFFSCRQKNKIPKYKRMSSFSTDNQSILLEENENHDGSNDSGDTLNLFE